MALVTAYQQALEKEREAARILAAERKARALEECRRGLEEIARRNAPVSAAPLPRGMATAAEQ